MGSVLVVVIIILALGSGISTIIKNQKTIIKNQIVLGKGIDSIREKLGIEEHELGGEE